MDRIILVQDPICGSLTKSTEIVACVGGAVGVVLVSSSIYAASAPEEMDRGGCDGGTRGTLLQTGLAEDYMSVFGSRSAEIDGDEFEHLLRAELARVSPSRQRAVVEPEPCLEVDAPEFLVPRDAQDDDVGALEEPHPPELDEIRYLDRPVPEGARSKD